MRTILVLCTMLFLAVAASAETINCPLPEARTEVITTIPSPWWQTPQIGRLQGTAIETIGGHATLVCKYSAYDASVRVMRLPPKGTTCTALKTGFVCR